MVIDYTNRILTAERYLRSLSSNLSKGWLNMHHDFSNGSLDCVNKLTMVHPDFVKTIRLPNHITHQDLIREFQNRRSFDQERGLCQCKLIWGYECFNEVNLCHGDHLFPYSLGGPTIAANKLLLCRYHNMVKSTDIHLFPWEDGNRLSWIDNQIIKINNRLQIYL